MGYVKDLIERLGGGYPPDPDVHVCASCLGDEELKDFVEAEADAKSCSFCGAESNEPIAAPLIEMLLYMKECLDREYDHAENKLGYESAEGGYIGDTWSTRELLGDMLGLDFPNDEDGSLMDALCDGLGDSLWCRLHPYSLTDDERLRFSWEEFCDLVKHHRRYFFLREEQSDGELYTPLDLLNRLANWCERFGLVKTFPAGTKLYRARNQKTGEMLSAAGELGPPREENATMSNRMSPPGVVMFYVSDSPETALRETANCPGTFAVGEFETLRDAKILDVSEVPAVPSIFASVPDSLEYDPRPPAIFLNYFAIELSKPIARDNRVHVEYVPTQIVTEYFRTEIRHEGTAIDGIRYWSARHSEHVSLVLFATQGDLADVIGAAGTNLAVRTDAWIRLVGREDRAVTDTDLEQWRREAPPEIDWI